MGFFLVIPSYSLYETISQKGIVTKSAICMLFRPDLVKAKAGTVDLGHKVSRSRSDGQDMPTADARGSTVNEHWAHNSTQR